MSHRDQGSEVEITEEVVKAAGGNKQSGKEVMILLLQERDTQLLAIAIMDFVERFQALQLQRDIGDELIKVGPGYHASMVDCLGSTSLSPQSSCIWTIFLYTVCYASLQGSTRGRLKLGIYIIHHSI